MGTADKIRELIEQTATIKANFHLENSLSFSSYDWRKREKKINYMPVSYTHLTLPTKLEV